MRVFAAIGILLLLAACGQTGPLYLPQKPGTEKPATPAPAPKDPDSTESEKESTPKTEPR